MTRRLPLTRKTDRCSSNFNRMCGYPKAKTAWFDQVYVKTVSSEAHYDIITVQYSYSYVAVRLFDTSCTVFSAPRWITSVNNRQQKKKQEVIIRCLNILTDGKMIIFRVISTLTDNQKGGWLKLNGSNLPQTKRPQRASFLSDH